MLWDSSRKCLDIIAKLQKETELPGWRKIKYIRKNIKTTFRATSHQVFKGKNEKNKKKSVKKYLQLTQALVDRCEAIFSNAAIAVDSPTMVLALVDLKRYKDYAVKMIDLIERRLINNEIIPAAEKIYSIFEPHTEWINKGKLNKKAELGHLLLITTDQYQFIVDYKVMESEKDPAQIPSLITRIKQKFKDRKIYSQSVDKGFYSKVNYEALVKSGIQEVIMLKKGNLIKRRKKEKAPKNLNSYDTPIQQ